MSAAKNIAQPDTVASLRGVATELRRDLKGASTELAALRKRLGLLSLAPGAPLPGGIFGGIVYINDAPHALVVGPEYDGSLTWTAAMKWAASQKLDGVADFTLPTRIELSLCYAYLRSSFKPEWYWSSEQHASYSTNAWYQYFDDGYQDYWYKVNHLRARAFRRLAI